MPARPRYRLPVGAGIDRSTGEFALPPGGFRDIRNAIPREGKLVVRQGISHQVGIVMDGSGHDATDIILIDAFRQPGRGLVIAHELGGGDDNIEAFITAVSGLNPTYVGNMPAAATPAGVVPRLIGAESYGKYFLAHEEADITARRVTRVITYTAPSTFTVTDLTADLDGAGAAPVQFRAVVPYLGYLIGFGFGSASDADRPDAVRISDPADPSTFGANSYVLFGSRSESCLNGVAVSGSFVVFKETETYQLFGYDRYTFGKKLIDPDYGLAGARLFAMANGVCYFWSREGPRLTDGNSPSVDLGLPLDLGGPDPADLVADGDAAYAWAHYIPQKRGILFAFPNRDLGKTRCYFLALSVPSSPRWSYFEVQRVLLSAGTLYGVAGGAPTGYPLIGALVVNGVYSITVPWDNTSDVGDETVEVWFSDDGGTSYIKATEVSITGPSQSVDLLYGADGVSFALGDTVYVALRYRRGTDYTAGYDNPVTSGWTGTAIGHSVADVAIPATVPPPTDVVQSACRLDTVGPKQYKFLKVSCTSAIAEGTVEIWNNTVNDTGTAHKIGEFDVTALGDTDESDWFGNWLKVTVDSYEYIWLRHKGPDGSVSTFVAMDTNPINNKDGCLL